MTIHSASRTLILACCVTQAVGRNGQTVVRTSGLRPRWLDHLHSMLALDALSLMERHFGTWVKNEVRRTENASSANLRIYATVRGFEVAVAASSGGALIDDAGRVSACARAAWAIRDNLPLEILKTAGLAMDEGTVTAGNP